MAVTPVIWERVSSDDYEDMVSVLLSTLNPDVERIDGSGGDGGRDVQFRRGETLDLYELKSFTGRVSKEGGRRRQVERSLSRAERFNPHSWALVVPINHTPGELDWFDGLRSQYGFPLLWLGRDWLNRQMADHPRIVRYFLQGGEHEALEALRELHAEHTVLAGGYPDAVARLQTLQRRIDDLDPHYTVSVAIDNESVRFEVVPRYLGAQRDHPIVVHFEVAFPDTPVGQETTRKLEQAVNYGAGASFEPDEISNVHVEGLVGLENLFLNPTGLRIYPNLEQGLLDLDVRLEVTDADGSVLSWLPIRLTERQRGLRGVTVSGADLTGSLRVEIRAGGPPLSATVRMLFDPPPDMVPGALLPLLRAVQHFCAPNRALIRLGGLQLAEAVAFPVGQLVQPELVALMEDLGRVQAFSGSVFPVPTDLGREDTHAIRNAGRLVTGERVSIGGGALSTSFSAEEAGTLLELARSDDSVAFVASVPNYSIKIAGIDVPLGTATMFVAPARIVELETQGAGDRVHFDIRPNDGHVVELMLGVQGDQWWPDRNPPAEPGTLSAPLGRDQ
ncbi:MAG: hypothetical protein QOG43_386 [Actinomycetota bacterium]|jgi:hypothetical protein|nr:hypothetical protein [Actinomycetota bacterium]